MIKTGDIY